MGLPTVLDKNSCTHKFTLPMFNQKTDVCFKPKQTHLMTPEDFHSMEIQNKVPPGSGGKNKPSVHLIKKFEVNAPHIRISSDTVTVEHFADVDPQTLHPIRAGIIPYQKYSSNRVKFCLGIHAHSHNLSDFGGGVKKHENFIDAALREYEEETLGVLESITPEILSDSLLLTSSEMVLILCPIKLPSSYKTDFKLEADRQRSLSKRVEISEITFLNEQELYEHCVKTELPGSTDYTGLSNPLEYSQNILYTPIRELMYYAKKKYGNIHTFLQ